VLLRSIKKAIGELQKKTLFTRRLMAAPAAVPAAAAGVVGIIATVSVVVGRLAGATEVTAPPAGRSPVASPAAVEVLYSTLLHLPTPQIPLSEDAQVEPRTVVT
jgi:hypothetical protein